MARPKQEGWKERDKKIREMYLVGHVVKDIGIEVGLTRERCRQIVRDAGIQMANPVSNRPLHNYARGELESLGIRRPEKQLPRATGGYILVRCPDHPRATTNGYVLEHRLVAERCLGRALESSEVVHHIDEDRANNSPKNLAVFENSGYHRWSWHRFRGKPLDESRVTWVVPESRDNMIAISGWPN